MVFLMGIAATAAGAVLAFWLTRSAAERRLAEQRAALAREMHGGGEALRAQREASPDSNKSWVL